MSADVETRVAGGIRQLNAFFGGHSWMSRIYTSTLDMESDSKCILGQLFRSYRNGIAALGSQVDQLKHGFAPCLEAPNKELTEEWRRRIYQLNCPDVGDKVEVTFVGTWPANGYSCEWKFSGFEMQRVYNIAPKVQPEPGHRVQHNDTGERGTVLKPNSTGMRVRWDAGGTTEPRPNKLRVLTAA